MAEIKKEPEVMLDVNGDEIVMFTMNHTIADFIRYLLKDTSRDELLWLVKTVK
jgi:hypothetical protein